MFIFGGGDGGDEVLRTGRVSGGGGGLFRWRISFLWRASLINFGCRWPIPYVQQ